MKGDFSRIRFNRAKSYTSVLSQQGRVAVDADANEQRFIDESLRRTETVDVVGEFGGPVGNEGFDISFDTTTNQIMIGPGRYYIDGLLCENPQPIAFDSQPFLVPGTPRSADLLNQVRNVGAGITHALSLQAWQRLVTALDDPCLREPALGQANTTARLQTVWRVVARPAPPLNGTSPAAACLTLYKPPPPKDTGTLTAMTSGPSADCGCGPVPAAGYQGVENQLYRVEILTGGDETTTTFAWSRENASIVSAITGISGSTVQLDSLGPDANLGFQALQWVELTDDSYQFADPPNQPGTLYQIQSVQPDDLSVTLNQPVTGIDPGLNARLRRWDQSGLSAGPSGVPVAAGTWIPLENGIQVQFGTGTYSSGDYWTIPARTASGQIDWPPCGSDGNPAQPPRSVRVHEAPLAILYTKIVVGAEDKPAGDKDPRFNLNMTLARQDCRRPFSPLTALYPPSAIHVKTMSWVNDDVITLDQLVNGPLWVTLDQRVASPVSGANFVVAIEPVTLEGSTDGVIDPRQSHPTVIRAQYLLDSVLSSASTLADEQVVTWQLPYTGGSDYTLLTVQYINKLLLPGAQASLFARVRVRLLGHAFFGTDPAAPVYLDGRALGKPGKRADGVTPRVDLRMPSGDGSAWSDFDSWFYLAPVLEFSATNPLTVAYPALDAVITNGTFTGVEPPGGTGLVDQTATISLSYPPISAVTIPLTLTATAVGNYASIPPSVTIPAGQQAMTFPVTISGAPQPTAAGGATTISFTISASLSSLVTGWSSQATSPAFTLTGPA